MPPLVVLGVPNGLGIAWLEKTKGFGVPGPNMRQVPIRRFMPPVGDTDLEITVRPQHPVGFLEEGPIVVQVFEGVTTVDRRDGIRWKRPERGTVKNRIGRTGGE